MTTQALERLPRGQTIEALLAFNSMKCVLPLLLLSRVFADLLGDRDKLKAFLEPFRDGGKVVSAGDIEEFMQSVKQSRRR